MNLNESLTENRGNSDRESAHRRGLYFKSALLRLTISAKIRSGTPEFVCVAWGYRWLTFHRFGPLLCLFSP